jgi:phosphoglycerate kinase
MGENTFNLSLLQEAELKDKVVLLRVDHNVVKKGKIIDPYRIDATIGTLYYIASKGGKPVLMTHVGRPKDKKTGEINTSADSSVNAIADYLEKKLNTKFVIPELPPDGTKGITSFSSSLKPYIDDLRNSKISALYLPNIRWFAGEQAKGDDAEKFAAELAGMADVFVNDAFGSWQAHTSTVRLNKHLPYFAGFLMQKEVENLAKIYTPQRPFVAVVAGSKFDTKIEPMFALLKLADYIIMGGVMYNAYISAKFGFSIKGIEEDDLAAARKFAEEANKYPGKVVELPYIIESDSFEGKFDGQNRVHDIRKIEPGTNLNFVLDIAKQSFDEPNVKEIIAGAKMFFVNAVMGLTPHFTDGTIALDKAIDANKDAMKLFGGGDTLQDMKQFVPEIYYKAIDDPKYYMFTGGGAVLTAIQEGTVLGIEPVKALVRK